MKIFVEKSKELLLIDILSKAFRFSRIELIRNLNKAKTFPKSRKDIYNIF